MPRNPNAWSGTPANTMLLALRKMDDVRVGILGPLTPGLRLLEGVRKTYWKALSRRYLWEREPPIFRLYAKKMDDVQVGILGPLTPGLRLVEGVRKTYWKALSRRYLWEREPRILRLYKSQFAGKLDALDPDRRLALDRSAEAIDVYDDLLARFGTATELSAARRWSPRRSTTRGSGSARSTAAPRQSMSTTISWPASAPPPSCHCAKSVANALVNKGIILGALNRSAEAIDVCDDLLDRFGTATELPLREPIANALVNKGIRLGALDRSAEAIAVYDDLLDRFGTATTELLLREPIAEALVNKGIMLGALDGSAEAIAAFEHTEDILAALTAVADTDIEQNVAGYDDSLGTTATDPPTGSKEAKTGFLKQVVVNLSAAGKSAADERVGECLPKDEPAAHQPVEVDETTLPPKNGADPAGSDVGNPMDEVTAQRQKRDQLRKDKRTAVPVIKHLGTSIVPDNDVLYRYITMPNIDDAVRLIADSGLSIDQWKEAIEKYKSANGAVIATAIPMQDASAKLRMVGATKEATERVPAGSPPSLRPYLRKTSHQRRASKLPVRRQPVAQQQRRPPQKAGASEILSPAQVDALLEKSVGKARRRFYKLLETIERPSSPATGYETLVQAKAAGRLMSQLSRLRAKQKEIGLPPEPDNEEILEIERARSAFYRSGKHRVATATS